MRACRHRRTRYTADSRRSARRPAAGPYPRLASSSSASSNSTPLSSTSASSMPASSVAASSVSASSGLAASLSGASLSSAGASAGSVALSPARAAASGAAAGAGPAACEPGRGRDRRGGGLCPGAAAAGAPLTTAASLGGTEGTDPAASVALASGCGCGIGMPMDLPPAAAAAAAAAGVSAETTASRGAARRIAHSARSTGRGPRGRMCELEGAAAAVRGLWCWACWACCVCRDGVCAAAAHRRLGLLALPGAAAVSRLQHAQHDHAVRVCRVRVPRRVRVCCGICGASVVCRCARTGVGAVTVHRLRLGQWSTGVGPPHAAGLGRGHRRGGVAAEGGPRCAVVTWSVRCSTGAGLRCESRCCSCRR